MNDIPKKIVKPTFDSIHQLWDCRMWGVKGIDNVGNDIGNYNTLKDTL